MSGHLDRAGIIFVVIVLLAAILVPFAALATPTVSPMASHQRGSPLSSSRTTRYKVAAHKTSKKLLRVLSAYDVANVQFLARRLLLESLGFWGHFKRRR